MWRLDCGRFEIEDLEGQGPVSMPTSCYLIRHGGEYVLFDAGIGADLHGNPERQTGQTIYLDVTLADQLERIGVNPAAVKTLIVSHYHGDHHGQANLFTAARLLIGAGDAAALRNAKNRGKLEPWLAGERPMEEVSSDRDLFGDRRLIVLFTPGHTPGHLSLLVRLAGKSYVLTGDLIHQRRQIAGREPSGNHLDKVRGKAEIERVLALGERENAEIIVGHDKSDIGRLPIFPESEE